MFFQGAQNFILWNVCASPGHNWTQLESKLDLHHVLRTLFQGSFILSGQYKEQTLLGGPNLNRLYSKIQLRKEKPFLYTYLFITSECSQLEKNTQTIVAGCSRTYSHRFFILKWNIEWEYHAPVWTQVRRDFFPFWVSQGKSWWSRAFPLLPLLSSELC